MTTGSSPGDRPARFAFIDVVKGVAIVAMVVYHAAFDLSAQRLIAVDVIRDPGWTIFARLIAGTFIGLVGFNLVLAHARGFRVQRFFRRLAVIVAAAAVVSLATWWFDPETFVFFGILHQIALTSLVGAAFLTVPSVILAGLAAIVVAAPFTFSHAVFDTPVLWWVGLSANPASSIDYVPFFPWFGIGLAGMVVGRMFLAAGTQSGLARWQPRNRLARVTIATGRWSLPIYLVHQPILVGIVFLIAPLIAPDINRERAYFDAECRPVCVTQGNGEAGCTRFCTCMFEGLYDTDLYALQTLEQMSVDQRPGWDDLISRCSAEIPPPLE